MLQNELGLIIVNRMKDIALVISALAISFLFFKNREAHSSIQSLEKKQVAQQETLKTMCLGLGGQVSLKLDQMECKISKPREDALGAGPSSGPGVPQPDNANLLRRIVSLENSFFTTNNERVPLGVVSYGTETFENNKNSCVRPWGLGICVNGKFTCLIGKKSVLESNENKMRTVYGCYFAESVLEHKVTGPDTLQVSIVQPFVEVLKYNAKRLFVGAECRPVSAGFVCPKLSLKNHLWRVGMTPRDVICGIQGKRTLTPDEFSRQLIQALSTVGPEGLDFCVIRDSKKLNVKLVFNK